MTKEINLERIVAHATASDANGINRRELIKRLSAATALLAVGGGSRNSAADCDVDPDCVDADCDDVLCEESICISHREDYFTEYGPDDQWRQQIIERLINSRFTLGEDVIEICETDSGVSTEIFPGDGKHRAWFLGEMVGAYDYRDVGFSDIIRDKTDALARPEGAHASIGVPISGYQQIQQVQKLLGPSGLNMMGDAKVAYHALRLKIQLEMTRARRDAVVRFVATLCECEDIDDDTKKLIAQLACTHECEIDPHGDGPVGSHDFY